MSKEERENLKALLKYWIAHNEDHSAEFSEWAEKAKDMDEAEVAGDLKQAVEYMNKANTLFSQSLKKLGKKGK